MGENIGSNDQEQGPRHPRTIKQNTIQILSKSKPKNEIWENLPDILKIPQPWKSIMNLFER